jgi:hypothetical protein
MLETWDFVILCLKAWDWVTGRKKRNFVLARNGFVYKGSGLFGLLTIVLTTIRSMERSSCSDPNPGSQCSYDGNRTYLQEWTNVGIFEQTWECLAIGFELMWMAYKTHKLAPVEVGYICVDDETGKPMACPKDSQGH